MTRHPYAQAYGGGECGMAAILNALRLVLHPIREEDAGHLLKAMAGALPAGSPRDLARILYEDGTERPGMALMLAAARAWTQARSWPEWEWMAAHPRPGQRASAFWSGLATRMGAGRAAIIGFGADDRPNSRYAPHWTCVETVGPKTVDLLDSAGYGRVRRSETGIRPERGWSIEDAFTLRKTTS